ncbi:hypothetical protein [Marichromatium gracile]|uniref:Uncharacterized protein n=1 Tax=Marichromatium gracile TaxID=1048 RepID=A0ABR5VFR8_MARGR|nr:hypothetical protein [Marichromatium gracile]KXX64205.1 hypothetical protein AY586_14755 [Marichromatium gracile]
MNASTPADSLSALVEQLTAAEIERLSAEQLQRLDALLYAAHARVVEARYVRAFEDLRLARAAA